MSLNPSDPPVSWMHDATKQEGGTPVPLPMIGKALTAIVISDRYVLLVFDREVLQLELKKQPQTKEEAARNYSRIEIKIQIGEWTSPEPAKTPDSRTSKEVFEHIAGMTMNKATAFAEGVVFGFGSYVLSITGYGVNLSKLDYIMHPTEQPPGHPC